MSPWNKGKAVGPRAAFSREEVAQIESMILRGTGRNRLRDACLFRLGIDTMLRCSDLLRLTVEDVAGRIEFHIRQHKTGALVRCNLSPKGVNAVQNYLAELAGAPPETRLFPFSDKQYRRLVKDWAKLVRLDPRRFSTHSLRRTRAKAIYAQTQNLAAVRKLLGHRNLTSTAAYLGVEEEDAAEVHRSVDI